MPQKTKSGEEKEGRLTLWPCCLMDPVTSRDVIGNRNLSRLPADEGNELREGSRQSTALECK
ncbi:Uncharacterized protein APZ42_026311 [Daphnia magna]|uniref:Uncharacterized protein n=1 Tax=Daphnia magna TaxID=35525 RepID=A0A164SCM8_9CRUS|nr:Uncharacterized protein APZ42_026311 [Daphnia magna]